MSRNWHTNSVLKKDTKTSSDVYTQLQVTSDRPVGRPKPAAWCDAMHSYCFSMREAIISLMTFKFTLESNLNEGKFTFVTVEDCIDMDDAINHIHREFPADTIDHINEIMEVK